jgi:mannosyltransferase
VGVELPRAGRVAARAAQAAPGVLVGVTAALVYAWRVWVPSPWGDEAETLEVSRRSLSQMLAVTRHVDLVHLAFYLIAHLVLRVHDSVTSVRAVSVLAMAGAAALLVPVGRRLGGTATGVLAGCLLVVNPLASRWAQEARPYACVVFVAVLSTLMLLRACDRPERTSRWVGYGLTLVLLCLFNVLALLLVAAHGAFLLATRRRTREWLITSSAAGVSCLPFVAATAGQRGQVSWLVRPHLYDLTSLYILAFASKAGLLVVAAVAATLCLAVVRHRGLPPGPGWNLLALGSAWALLPPLLLWGVSYIRPLFDLHWVLFTLPGLALMLASASQLLVGATIGRRRASGRPHPVDRPDRVPGRSAPGAVSTGALVVALVALVGVPAQQDYRRPDGHGEDLRGVVTYLAAAGRSGDVVLFMPYRLRVVATIYPGRTNALQDVALGAGPIATATISGEDVGSEALITRLSSHRRVWLVRATFPTQRLAHSDADPVKLDLPRLGYQLIRHRSFAGADVELYQS